MLNRWKTEFMDRVAIVFKKGPTNADKELQTEKERTVQLERKIDQLTYEVDWLNKFEELYKRKRP
jgi:putative transposase